MSSITLDVTGAANQTRNGRLYLTGLGASMLGDTSMALAAAIWASSLTGSNATAALVAVCIYAPALLGPLAGSVVDRFRRRPLLIAGNLAMAVIVPVLLLVDRADRVWLIYAVMLCYGISMVTLDPAENALFAVMFDEQNRGRLNGVRMSLQEGCKLVAPLAGAGLFVVLGGGTVAMLDAASFAIAAVAILRLRVHERKPARPEGSWRKEFVAGAAHVRGNRALRGMVLAGAVVMFVGGVTFPVAYALADAFGRSKAFVGVLTGVLGAGSIVAGLLTGRILRRTDERVLALLGIVNCVVGLLLGCAPWLPVAIAGWFVRGFGLPWLIVAVITFAQRVTPSELQGRVSAAISFLLFAGSPVAYLIGAGIIDHVDYRVPLALAALVSLACLAGVRRPRD